MLLLSVFTLCSLTVTNYMIGRRALFYPPVIFGLVWLFGLVLVLSARGFFYPLSAETLLIVCGGAVLFSVGAFTAMLFPQNIRTEAVSPKSSAQILNILVALAALGVPYCYFWINSLGAQYGGNFFAGARIALLDPDFESRPGTVLFNSIVNFSTAVAILAFCERGQSRRRSTVAIAIAILLNLMTGGRAGVTVLTFTLICIAWTKNRRLSWKPLLVIGVIFLTSFAVIAVFVSKGDARPDASLKENASAVAQGFVHYAAGGLVGFDRVVREPQIIPHNWQIQRPILRAASALGANVVMPPLHAEFVNIGPNSLSTNVYTFYFAYLDWGYLGMALILMALGFIAASWYKEAITGNCVAIPVYGMVVAGLMLTIFNELLFMNLSYLARLYILAWIVYRLPFAISRFARTATKAVESALSFLPAARA